MRSQALRADVLMLITAMIWGVVRRQRLGMDAIGPFLYTGLRFVLGALVLVPLLMLRSRRDGAQPFNRGQLLAGVILGVALTTGINLQVGLLFTSVTNSGFITGLYVIVVPLLGLLFGQRTGAGTWLGASLAVLGMALLSIGPGLVASGDWLQLAGAVVWGAHVLLVGLFASRYDPIAWPSCGSPPARRSACCWHWSSRKSTGTPSSRPVPPCYTAACSASAPASPCRWWRRSTPSLPMRRSSCPWKRCSPPSPAPCSSPRPCTCAAISVARADAGGHAGGAVVAAQARRRSAPGLTLSHGTAPGHGAPGWPRPAECAAWRPGSAR